jgi:2-dehydropantoate 2-reductase
MTRLAIVGAGAIGSVLAWGLTRAGFSPGLIARGGTLAQLRRDGLTVADKEGRRETVTVRATDEPQELGHQDIVIGTLKAQDWLSALPALEPLIGPATTIVPAVNGIPWWYFDGVSGPHAGHRLAAVDPDGTLRQRLPSRQVLGCVVHTGVNRLDDGSFRWMSGGRFILGPASGKRSADSDALAEMLEKAGFTASVTTEIRQEIWSKLLNNASLNPLSVVTRATVAEIANNPSLRRVAWLAMEEVAAVAAAVGAPIAISIEERMKMNETMVGLKTSMLQDFEAGRPLELGGLVDTVAEIGRLVGVATPVIEALSALAGRAAALR